MAILNLAPRSVAVDHFPHHESVFVVFRVANFGFGMIYVYHTGSFSDVLNRLSDWQERATTIDCAIAYLSECGFTQVSTHPK